MLEAGEGLGFRRIMRALGRTFSQGLGPPVAGYRKLGQFLTTGAVHVGGMWKLVLGLVEFVNIPPWPLGRARPILSPLPLVKHTVSRSPPNEAATSRLF